MRSSVGYIVIAAVGMLGACAHHPDAPAPATEAPVPVAQPILTDSTDYTLRGFTADMNMVYVNRNSFAVQFSRCQGLLPPLLQRWNGYEWIDGWRPMQAPQCTSTPIVVAPGEEYSHYEFVGGPVQPTRYQPAWNFTDPSGTYRVVWYIQPAPEAGLGTSLLPIAQRVSNNFRLRTP